jgi:hypothetical protein
MRILLPNKLQKELIEKYKNKFDLEWRSMSKLLNVGESTLRSKYRFAKASLPSHVFDELTRYHNNQEKQKLISLAKKLPERKYIKTNFSNTDRRKALHSLKKNQPEFFSRIGTLGANTTNKMWTQKRRIRQSQNGRLGGLTRISNTAFLTEQEKLIAEENDKLNLKYKSNFIIEDGNNFDFVYFQNNKIIGVEEVTLNAFRSFTYYIEKLTKINKKYPFILTVDSTKNSSYLLKILESKGAIIFTNLKNRRKYINQALEGKRFEFALTPTKPNNSAKSELNKPFNIFEEIVNRALIKLSIHPTGKHLFETPELRVVTDNRFIINNNPVNVLVSVCNSRGSLYYQMYRTATYSYLIKNIFKESVMSILFDFSGTASSSSENIPRKLWLNNCNHPIIIFKNDSNELKSKISKELNLGG